MILTSRPIQQQHPVCKIRRRCAAVLPETKRRCEELFMPRHPFVKFCCPEHGVLIWEANKAKEVAKNARKASKERREGLLAIKDRSTWLREAQAAFNAFIRERDKDQPCISCNRHHTGQYHAGHYRTTKAAPELRFNENNVHKQCSACNNHLSGNILEYRINLVRLYGQEYVDYIEGPHLPKKYTIPELQEIIKKYKANLKTLKS